jgi:hypothetical protein
MKAILLAGIILASSSLSSMAQTATATQPAKVQNAGQQVITKAAFEKQIATYVSSVGEATDANMNNYMPLAAMMTRVIGMNMQLMEKSEGTAKTQLKNLVERQNRIYSEAKMMSSDGAKNKKEMEKKLEEFKATL